MAAQPSERRNRGLEDASDRVDLRLLASNPPSDSAADTSHLATPRGADNVLSSALVLGSVSTLGKFLQVSIGLVSTRNPGPSSATVDSDAAQVPEWAREGCASGGHGGFFLDDTLAPRRAYP